MTQTTPPPGKSPQPETKPNELTGVAPDFTGRVSNRPTTSGDEVAEYAAEQERQEDA